MKKIIILIILLVYLIVYLILIFIATKPIFENTIKLSLKWVLIKDLGKYMIGLWLIFYLVVVLVVLLAFIIISYDIVSLKE